MAVIDAGLVETILPMLETHQPPVVFKLLGTLRMLVDGQAVLALKILNNQTLIEQLVGWAKKTPDMIGVNSESSRLMAWLIKNVYRSNVKADIAPLQSFVAIDGTVDTLIQMLLSPHFVMQNEAIIALTLIAVLLSAQPELPNSLIQCKLGETLADFIQRTSEMERTSNEIVENLNTFVTSLRKLDALKQHLSDNKIDEKLKILPRIKELATL